MSHNTQPRGKKRKLQTPSRPEGTHEEVLGHDVKHLLATLALTDEHGSGNGDNTPTPPLPDRLSEITVTIDSVSSTGDGLGRADGYSHIFVIPFTAPGDVVKARFVRYDDVTKSCVTDFISVVTPSPQRNDELIRCPYFASCSGCQFQMLPYSWQLEHKRSIVQRAYQNFSGVPAALVPAIGETIGSPLQYGYRTKLTPHFDGPPGARRAGRKGERARFEEVPEIGFMRKGTRKTIDIEECPIGTDAVQMGLRRERKRVVKELDKYARGATILLRESTERVSKPQDGDVKLGHDEDKQTVTEDRGDFLHVKSCVTDNKATTSEYIDDFQFKNLANSFFQNNNSILPVFTDYIRQHVKSTPPPASPYHDASFAPSSDSAGNEPVEGDSSEIENLIDAYCGSGLFTVTLSSLFKRSVGIDIDEGGITYARTNASLNAPATAQQEVNVTSEGNNNALPESQYTPPTFIAADARTLFSSVPRNFDPSKTAVIIDPPRKGCDEDFLRQLLAFGPQRIVYVSCNVHTQARDIGWMMSGGSEDKVGGQGDGSGGEYEMESLRGFDFFPQTGHVESVAVLRKKEKGTLTTGVSLGHVEKNNGLSDQVVEERL